MYPHEVSHSSGEPPKVIFWQKMYLGALALMYFLFVPLGGLMIWGGTEANDMGAVVQGVMIAFMCAMLGVGAAALIFTPRKPWAWTAHVVVLVLTVGSCCMPFALPILINWFKDETKDWYGA